MTTVLLIGVALGAGLALIVRGARRPAIRLGQVVARLNRPATIARPEANDASHGGVRRLVADSALATRTRASLRLSTTRDLRILGRTVERHVFDKLSCAVGLMIVPPLLGSLAASAGVALPAGMLLPIGAALVGAVAGFLLPDVLARSQAAARRRSFTHALSSYVDLVNVLLAGGAGVETALEAAAETGDGPAFVEIREALVRARAGRRSHWDAFADLGEAIGVEALVELAASMQLAGEQGARVRQSLFAKAASLRARQMAGIEASAQAASERMGLPVAAMFLGFLVFLGYPAVSQILGS